MNALHTATRVAALLAGYLVGPTCLALSVDLVPTTAVSGVAPGDTVSFDIVLDFTEEPTIGGGFDVAFDAGQLELLAITPNNSLGDPQYFIPPIHVADSGLIQNWGVADFNGITGGIVGSVEFLVLPTATSSVVALGPTEGSAGAWISAIYFTAMQNVQYGQVTVTAVPLPAAGWLLLPALAALFGLRVGAADHACPSGH